jgi:hypothetical protein
MRLRNVSAVLLILLLLGGAIWAQEITGSIAGSVKDATGAMIVGAKVTVRNTDQNVVVRTITTDDKGAYIATYLPIGHYSVTVDAKGFKKHIEKNIELNVNDKLTINATMQVGASTEVVEVQANPLQVELRSAETAGLVSGTQIRELSLNNRNYTQLVTLMPGVSNTGSEQFYVGLTNPLTGANNTLGISINGQRTSANNWTLDGADNVDRGSNLNVLMTPSVDAIAEFKVLKSNYSAEFGRSGASQVNVITKSGTSAFHGGAYEFWRNENLNADTFFGQQTNRYFNPTIPCRTEFLGSPTASGTTPNCDTRQPLRYHNFGWNLGGPVYIPGVYNTSKEKTFFFFSQEFRRVITYATGNLVALPTQAELSGVLAAPICTAWNVPPAPASPVCTSQTQSITNISPLAQAYIKDIYSKVQLPTDPANRLLRYNFRNMANYREELAKIDHVFGPRLTVYGRYINDSIPTYEPMGLFGPNTYLPGVGDTTTNAPGWSFVGRATATLSSRTMLELGYNFTYGALLSDPVGLMNPANSPDIKATLPFPMTLNSVPGIGFSTMAGLGTHPHYEDYNRNHQVFGNLTKIVGPHTFKFGATYYHYQKAENAAGSNIGSFVFQPYGAMYNRFDSKGNPTGYLAPDGTLWTKAQMDYFQQWGNFLMGHANTFSQASLDLYPDVRDNQIEFFGQDEWRVRRNLTISYGMRYSNFRQPTDAKGMLTSFDPKYYDPSKAPAIDPTNGNIINAASANLLNGVVPSSQALKTCQSLLASKQVPYCWADGTVAPYGSKVGNEYNLGFAPRIGIAWDPWGDGKTSVRSGYAMFYDTGLFGIVEQNIFTNPPFVQTLNLAATGASNPNSFIPLDNPTGSLSIAAKPMAVTSRVDPNYHTPYNQNWNLGVQRQVTPSMMVDVSYVGSRANHLLGIEDINQPYVGAYIGSGLRNACTPVAPATTCTGTLMDATSGMSDYNKLNSIRPYKGWGPINAIRTQFKSNYNSLQTSVEKRFKGASQVSFSYTWSKALTDNQTDRSTGLMDLYHPQLDYGPTQQDRRHVFVANFIYEFPWLKTQRGILGKVVGGWEFSGITTIQSGVPYTVTDSNSSRKDTAGTGCLNSASVAWCPPDVIRDPYATSDTRTFGATSFSWPWLNLNSFASVPAGQVRLGTSNRGEIYSPGMWRQDLSLFKNIQIGERVKTQLRFEGFNVFNHTNPYGVGTVWTPTSQTFGLISTTLINRIVQVGAKINF